MKKSPRDVNETKPPDTKVDAREAARLPGFKDPAKAEAQRNGLTFCAMSCMKAGVPRRR